MFSQLTTFSHISPFTILLFFFGLILILIYEWRRSIGRYAHLPTLPTSPVLGTLLGHLEYFTHVAKHVPITVALGNVAAGVSIMMRSMGEDLFYFRAGPFRHIVVAISGTTAQSILSDTKNLSKAPEYEFANSWLGGGLLTSTGSHWRRHRKLLTPTFHLQILQRFVPIMNGQLRTLVEIIEGEIERQSLCLDSNNKNYSDEKSDNRNSALIEDIRPLVDNCTVDMICETAMGVQVNAQKLWYCQQSSKNPGKNLDSSKEQSKSRLETEYVHSVQAFLGIVMRRFLRPWLHPNWLFNISPMGAEMRAHVRTLHAFTNGVIERRKANFHHSVLPNESVEQAVKRISSAAQDNEGSKTKLDFLDLMLLYHSCDPMNFDLDTIREQVDTFMFGGHDTTAATLNFCLLLFGLNHDSQLKAQQELDLILGKYSKKKDFNKEITSDHLKQMTYLEQCIKETLRLYPPLPFFGRTVTSDQPLFCGRHLIPKGATVFVLSSAVHRDPKVFPKPECFIPERFSKDSCSDSNSNNNQKNPFAFVPFSAGPRNCIGQRFALLELKLTLATILWRYSIRSETPRDQVELDCAIVAKSRTPIKMRFERRFNDGDEVNEIINC